MLLYGVYMDCEAAARAHQRALLRSAQLSSCLSDAAPPRGSGTSGDGTRGAPARGARETEHSYLVRSEEGVRNELNQIKFMNVRTAEQVRCTCAHL
jgi:hypothetical protein